MPVAARAECEPLEPPRCQERGLALLADDAGAPEVARAFTLMSEACKRGLATSCEAIHFERPKAIDYHLPYYTRAAREHDVQGTVFVRCTLPVTGKPRGCVIFKHLPYLT